MESFGLLVHQQVPGIVLGGGLVAHAGRSWLRFDILHVQILEALAQLGRRVLQLHVPTSSCSTGRGVLVGGLGALIVGRLESRPVGIVGHAGGGRSAVAAQLIVVRAGAGQMRLIASVLMLPATPVAVAHSALLAQSAGEIAAHGVGALIGAVIEIRIIVAALWGRNVASRQVVPAPLAHIGYLGEIDKKSNLQKVGNSWRNYRPWRPHL